MRILILSMSSLLIFSLSCCEPSRNQFEVDSQIVSDVSDFFGKWEQVVSEVDTILLPMSDLQREETYIFVENFSYEILNPRIYANAVEGVFEVDIENNRVDFIPFTNVPIVLNGDSVSIDLEIKPWYWEIVDLENDTLTIKEHERTGRFILDGDTHIFVKTE